MKPMQLNMSKVKKIAGDKKTSTFKHDDGHVIMILHSALPAAQRKLIEKMPNFSEGGDVELEAPNTNPNVPQAAKDDYAKESATRAAEKERYGQPLVKMYADPQEVVSADDSAPTAPAPQPEAQRDSQANTLGMNVPSVQQSTPNPAAVVAAQAPMQGVQIPTGSDGVPNLNKNGDFNPTGASQNTQTAIQDQKNNEIALGKSRVNIEQGQLDQISVNEQERQQKFNEMAGHTRDFNAWMNAHPINENHYMENLSTAKKVTTAIGLFLGGLGGGIAHTGGNVALDYLNRQIDRDIDAQKQRSDQAKTIYGAYRSLYGDSVATYNLTKASMLDAYTHKMNLSADLVGTATAKQRALQFGTDAAIKANKLIIDSVGSVSGTPGARPTGGGNGLSQGGGDSTQGGRPQGGKGSGIGGPAQNSSAPRGPQGASNTDDSDARDNAAYASVVGKGKNTESTKDPEAPALGGESSNNSTLVPGHKAMLQKLQKFDIYSKNPARADGLQIAYDQQVKVDQALSRVDKLYDTMYSETNGLNGRIHRGINPHAIAAGAGAIGTAIGGTLGAAGTMGLAAIPGALGGGSIGAGLGEGIGEGMQMMTNNDANGKYDTDFATLKSMIAAALPGRGDGLVEELARKYAPTDRDSKSGAIKKREALKADLVQLAKDGALTQTDLVKYK